MMYVSVIQSFYRWRSSVKRANIVPNEAPTNNPFDCAYENACAAP